MARINDVCGGLNYYGTNYDNVTCTKRTYGSGKHMHFGLNWNAAGATTPTGGLGRVEILKENFVIDDFDPAFLP